MTSTPVLSGTGMDVCIGVGTGFGTTSLLVPNTSESSVKQKPGTGHVGKIGKTSKPGTTTL